MTYYVTMGWGRVLRRGGVMRGFVGWEVIAFAEGVEIATVDGEEAQAAVQLGQFV